MLAVQLRQQLAPIGVQLQQMIDKCKAENRGFAADERTAFDKLVDDHTQLEASIARAEQGESIIQRISDPARQGRISDLDREELQDTRRLSARQKRDREKDPHARAFAKFLRNGIGGLEADERAAMQQRVDNDQLIRNALSTTTGSQGGFLVPEGFSGEIDKSMKWFGGMEPDVVTIFETETGNPFPWPGVNDSANRGRILGQNVQVVQNDPAFVNAATFNAYIGSSDLVLIPLALIQDSYFDMDGLVAELIGTRLGRLFNWKCTVGTGTNEPGGVVPEAVAAGSKRQFTTGLTAGISYDELVNVQHMVDPAYRSNARWMFHDTMLKLLKKLVDGENRPLWQPGLTASFRNGAAVDMIAAKPLILDSPYTINQDMPEPAASAYSMLYGDLKAFKVRNVSGGTSVLRLTERFADHLQVGFIGFRRFDSHLIDSGTHPIGVGQQAAA